MTSKFALPPDALARMEMLRRLQAGSDADPGPRKTKSRGSSDPSAAVKQQPKA